MLAAFPIAEMPVKKFGLKNSCSRFPILTHDRLSIDKLRGENWKRLGMHSVDLKFRSGKCNVKLQNRESAIAKNSKKVIEQKTDLRL
ncbi:hypothetical protein VB714_22370 [Spirulina sp. 06S082]|nr:hypothetical protein [Spirulina sp. 06S082]